MASLYKNKLTPCLWFDTQAEDAAKHYTNIFENSRIVHVSHYGSAGPRPTGMRITASAFACASRSAPSA